MKLQSLFNFFRSRYIVGLEKDKERLLLEVRHWQNQVLLMLRLQQLPEVHVPGDEKAPGEFKPITMPKIQTARKQRFEDEKAYDKEWEGQVMATNLELSRTLDLMKNGISAEKTKN